MFDEERAAWIVEGFGEVSGEADLFVELPNGQEARVGGKLSLRRLDDDRQGSEKVEGSLPNSLYNHDWPPFASLHLPYQQVRRARRPFRFNFVNNPG